MGSTPTPQPTADDVITRAKAAGNAVYDATNSAVNDPRLASEAASRAISHAISHSTALKGTIDAFMLLINPILTAFFATLGQVRKGVTTSMGDTTAEVLNEFLGTDLDGSVLETGQTSDELLAKCERIGTAILDRLEFEFTRNETVSPDSGAKAARTFAGYAANFGIQNAIVSLIAGCIPEVHIDDIRELGEDVASNLGLGALVSSALNPLVNNTIVKPYNRQLNAKYQQDILGIAELGRWFLRGTGTAESVKQLMREWGYSDEQLTELISQLQPRLGSAEWNVLTALGIAPTDQMQLQDVGRGMPDQLVKLKQVYETFHRLQRPRQRALQAVISQISAGFLQPSDLDKLLSELNVPEDEQAIWRITTGYVYERVRKRLSQADMLFLYEAAQITDSDVSAWAAAEGYSFNDQQQLLTLFQLKAAEASTKTTGGAAARAANLHKEHVAYVTDEITGIFGRAPTAAELNYWVQLLDTSQRTKHDFTTELKALPTTGPAIPPA